MTIATPPAGVSNGELVRWTFEVINGHDPEPLRQVWADDGVERFPSGTLYGREAIIGYFRTLFAALPDVHIEVLAVAETGADVFAHWRMTATHTGAPFEGIEATGRAVAIDGIDHFVVRDGRLVSNFVVFDQMQFARQIGMLAPDGTAADRAMKAAFNAKTRLLSRLRGRRRRT